MLTGSNSLNRAFLIINASRIHIWVVVYYHKHGDACSVHTSYDDAYQSVVNHALEYWDNVFSEDPPEENEEIVDMFYYNGLDDGYKIEQCILYNNFIANEEPESEIP